MLQTRQSLPNWPKMSQNVEFRCVVFRMDLSNLKKLSHERNEIVDIRDEEEDEDKGIN